MSGDGDDTTSASTTTTTTTTVPTTSSTSANSQDKDSSIDADLLASQLELLRSSATSTSTLATYPSSLASSEASTVELLAEDEEFEAKARIAYQSLTNAPISSLELLAAEHEQQLSAPSLPSLTSSNEIAPHDSSRPFSITYEQQQQEQQQEQQQQQQQEQQQREFHQQLTQSLSDSTTHDGPIISVLSSIRHFVHLQHLDLSRCHLTDQHLVATPEAQVVLPQLQSIQLYENKLQHIPEWLLVLPQLTSITASSNEIAELPQRLFQCSTLRDIDLSDNALTQFTPIIHHQASTTNSSQANEQWNLPELGRLLLSKNRITSFDDRRIAQLTSLTRLDLSHNRIAECPQVICHLTNLRTLRMESNQLQGIAPSYAVLTSLRELALKDNPLQPIPREITQLAYRHNVYLQTSTADEIVKGLYLGPQEAASSLAYLESLNIHSIVRVLRDASVPVFADHFTYHIIPIPDLCTFDISQFFSDAARFIESELEQGRNVLVHCAVGMSRSASIVIAYLMFAQRMSLDQAVLWTRRRRPIISPNNGFMQQLQEMEQQINLCRTRRVATK
jgi:Leucine-rich repeat (LRR) protein